MPVFPGFTLLVTKISLRSLATPKIYQGIYLCTPDSFLEYFFFPFKVQIPIVRRPQKIEKKISPYVLTLLLSLDFTK